MNGSISITLTEAKAKFSELINRIIFNKEKIYISKKGKHVPLEEVEEDKEEGLILAKQGLAGLENEINEMEDIIYKARVQKKELTWNETSPP